MHARLSIGSSVGFTKDSALTIALITQFNLAKCVLELGLEFG